MNSDYNRKVNTDGPDFPIWFRLAYLLFGLSLACLPLSFLPFLGILFFLPFSDLVLLALAALIVGIAPIPGRIRWTGLQTSAVQFVLVWIGLSLILEAPLIPRLLAGNDQLTHPKVVIHHKIENKKLSQIAVIGDANPIVASMGRRNHFAPSINLAGMRETEISSAANNPTHIDIVDVLWRRGITPNIGAETFPQLRVHKTDRFRDFDLHIQILSANEKVAGSYKRTLERAPPYPGIRPNSVVNFFKSIFYFNLWRTLLGRNEQVNLEREVSGFLDATLGLNAASSERLGPMEDLQVITDKVIESDVKGDASGQLKRMQSTKLDRGETGNRQDSSWDVCELHLTLAHFGYDGNDPEFWVAPSGSPPGYSLLRLASHGNRLIEYYCAVDARQILAFSYFDQNPPNLKISTFSLDGKLKGVRYMQLPSWLVRGGFVGPASWNINTLGEVGFTWFSPIKIREGNGNTTTDRDHYRAVEFRSGSK
jgi:hypothetical protein